MGMKRFFSVFLFLILFSYGVEAGFVQIPYCDLDVKIDISNSRYDIKATVDFIPDTNSTFIFLYMDNEIKEITTIDGNKVHWSTIGSRLMITVSEDTLVEGDLHRIIIKYYGYAKIDPKNYSIICPEYISLRPAIFWLPVYPDLVQVKLNYRMKIGLPSNFVLVTDGSIENEWVVDDLTYYQVQGGGQEPVLIAAPFTTGESTLSDTRIRYYYRENQLDEETRIQRIARSSKEALDFYQKYQIQFPEILNILLFPNESANAEPNMVVFPEKFDLDQDSSVIDLSIFHEVFHLIVPANVGAEEPWLSEGLAHYMGFKSLANKYGMYSKSFRIAVMALLQPHHLWHDAAWLIPLSDSRYSEKTFGTYAPYLLHDRPAMVLYTLDYALGEEQMTGFWTALFNKYWGGKLNIENVREELRTSFGESLNWFFEDWIDGVVRPDYVLEDVEIVQNNSSYAAAGIVRNIGTGRAVVPVAAFNANGELLAVVNTRLVENKHSRFWLETDQPIAYLEVDPAKLLIQTNLINDIWRSEEY